jgi:hypothetical protein
MRWHRTLVKRYWTHPAPLTRATQHQGGDPPTGLAHAAQEQAIAGYIRWHNRHAQPKRNFAVGSKIRRPDYLPNVA